MKWVTLFFAFAFLSLAIMGFLAPDRYGGKAVFSSVGEYQVFKEAVASEEVDIKSLDVLSSDPPIVVSFSVVVPRGSSFEFGEKSDKSVTMGVGLLAFFLLLGLTFWMHIYDIRDARNIK